MLISITKMIEDQTATLDEEQIRQRFQRADKFLKEHSDRPVPAKELRRILEEVIPNLEVAAPHIAGGRDCLVTWQRAYELTEGAEGNAQYHYYNWCSHPMILNLEIDGKKAPDGCYTSDEMILIASGPSRRHGIGERIGAGLASIVSGSWRDQIRKDDQYLQKFFAHLNRCDSCGRSYSMLLD